jgi:hypothetical protein
MPRRYEPCRCGWAHYPHNPRSCEHQTGDDDREEERALWEAERARDLNEQQQTKY